MLVVNFDFINLTEIETQNILHRRSLMKGNQNDVRSQGFSFGNLEMQHTKSWVLMNLRRRYIVTNTERSLATAICKLAPRIAFDIWRDHGQLVTQGMANASLFGHILVSARLQIVQ